jgi:hypothetical protein
MKRRIAVDDKQEVALRVGLMEVED